LVHTALDDRWLPVPAVQGSVNFYTAGDYGVITSTAGLIQPG
jgi:hypothetical protein